MADYVYTERRARVQHNCKMGDGPILPGMKYYAATIGGGGLGSLKYPTYLHLHCKEAHTRMREEKRGISTSNNNP